MLKDQGMPQHTFYIIYHYGTIWW